MANCFDTADYALFKSPAFNDLPGPERRALMKRIGLNLGSLDLDDRSYNQMAAGDEPTVG